MNKLIEIGECLVDISMIASVEPHMHGYHLGKQGAKVTLQNGVVVFETRNSLREVKEKIQGAYSHNGWKVVPLEPTPEMIAAAMDCDDVSFGSDESFCVNFGNIYAAMLTAAPGEPKKC